MADVVSLLRDCIVRVVSANEDNPAFGTGFFVAPGRVMTCGHVVEACGSELAVWWNETRYAVKAEPTMIPPERGGHRYHLLPDLAVIELYQELDHPSVWLSETPPQRGAPLMAVGFNRWVLPRSSGAGLQPPSMSEVRLNLVGLDGECWRVDGDDLTSGMSGGPVLDLMTGRVAAMVKAKIDSVQRQVVGGWIVGVDSIARELPVLVDDNSAVNPPGSKWRDVVSRREELTREVFGGARPSNQDESIGVRPPAWWLRPDNHVVRFVPPPEFGELLDGWCLDDSTNMPSVRLMHAPGGVGKTRLSLELAAELRGRGWVAGVASTDQDMASLIHLLPAMLRANHPVFCAVDYAETSIAAVKRLITTLDRHRPGIVRILLLARTPGNWWRNLALAFPSTELIDPLPLGLRDIGRDDPVGIASAAYRSFRLHVLGDDGADERPIPDGLVAVARGQRRALDLHAAALVQVLNESSVTSSSNDPIEALLQHERVYWQRSAETRARVTFADVSRLSDRLLVVPTLCPLADALSAEQIINRLPGQGEVLPCPAEYLAKTLADLYPGDEGRYWSPLVPDRVGEKLLEDVIRAHPSALRAADEMVKLVGDADSVQAAHVVTLLARVAGFTDPGSVQQATADRAYTLIARLASHNPVVFGSMASEILAPSAGRDATSRSISTVVRRPLSAGKSISSFSDTANIMGAAYGTWLGAAFPPGGSNGFEYRTLGITARGAWEAAKQRLSAAGIDPSNRDITVVGIGDMSGDVFGNGMLSSRRIKLIAAFDHRHIFLDPNPDSASSYRERQRLFSMPYSSWADYDPALISPGGGVWPRASGSIPISAAVRAALGVSAPMGDGEAAIGQDSTVEMSPVALIRAILMAPVDMMWNGGIGTYVKGVGEADVGDAVNDPVRVNGRDLRCRVVVEAGSLGLTQRGRVEYAMRGGWVAADFIDASAGVGFFDREVNVKILLGTAVIEDSLDRSERTRLLGSAADEMAAMVAVDSRDQVNGLNATLSHSAVMLSVHRRMLIHLERRGQLDRALEGVADDPELAERAAAGLGLTGPELAVLMAHVKILLARDIASSAVPEEDWTRSLLIEYFPSALRWQFDHLLSDHPLRREIIATRLADEVVNRAGVSFVFRVMEEAKASIADVIRAYATARDVYGLPQVWRTVDAIEDLAAEARATVYLDMRELLDRAVRWILASRRLPIDVASEVARMGPAVERLLPMLEAASGGDENEGIQAYAAGLYNLGIPHETAQKIARTKYDFGTLELVQVVTATAENVDETVGVYLSLHWRFRIGALFELISALPRDDHWQARARAALHLQLYRALAAITLQVLAATDAAASADERVFQWESANASAINRVRRILADDMVASHDLPSLIVLLRAIRTLAGTSRSSLQH